MSLTAFNLQGAVLLIQWVSAQVHHAGSCRGDPKRQKVLSYILLLMNNPRLEVFLYAQMGSSVHTMTHPALKGKTLDFIKE